MKIGIYDYKNTMLETFKIIKAQYLNELLSTGIALLSIFSIYFVIYFFIKKQDWSAEKKHKHNVSIRNIFIILFLISFIFIWSGELKTFLLSATAIFGATLIVFKEIIMSFTGGLLMGKNFNIGDYVEYDGIEGVIVDKNFLNTKILIGKSSHKELIIPNMFFVTNKLINSSKFGKYQVYNIEIGCNDHSDAYKYGNLMMQAANKVLESHKIKYYEYFKEKQKTLFLFDIPQLDPKITYHLGDVKKIYFTLSYISHPKDKEDIENQIYKEYFLLLNHAESKNTELQTSN